MKNLFILSLFVLVFGNLLARASNEVVISGKAVPGTKVFLEYDRGMVRREAETKTDDSGNFTLNYQVGRPGIYTLVADRVKGETWLFLRPGWNVKADLTKENIVLSGDGVKENQFLQALKSREKELAKEYPQNLSDALAYKTVLLKQLEEVQKFVAGASLEDTLFAGTLKALLAVQTYHSLLSYPFVFQLINPGNTVILPQGYYDFLPLIDLNSPYLANVGKTDSFLQEVFTAMESEGYLQVGITDYLAKRAARLNDPLVREEYLLYALNIELLGYNQYLGKMMEQIDPWITTSEGRICLKEYKEKYATQVEANRHLDAGQKAPDFEGIDVAGQKHSLSDYRGKVVVVDVWNTGCKPCIAEIPFLETLEKKFAGQEVVFISLSLENGVDKWKGFVKEHNMDGNQWIDTEAFRSSFVKNYNVRYVPRFMVIDKSGNIVETYAPRPSNPRLGTLIDIELKKTVKDH